MIKEFAVVKIFKTNIESENIANEITKLLYAKFPGQLINFDLEDCDCILRFEGENPCSDEIIFLMEKSGFFCKEIE